MSFQSALSFVLQAEGGYSNDPADHGGSTNHGITQSEYTQWLAANGKSPGDVRNITDQEVSIIYQHDYWNVGHCPDLPNVIAFVHFDACVQHGVGRAAKFLQTALGVTADGLIGPGTLGAAQKSNQTVVAATYVSIRRNFYNAIVAHDSTQGRFLSGWLNRMDSLQKAMNS